MLIKHPIFHLTPVLIDILYVFQTACWSVVYFLTLSLFTYHLNLLFSLHLLIILQK